MFIIGHWSGVYKSTVYMGRENSHVFDKLLAHHGTVFNKTKTSLIFITSGACGEKYEAWTILDIDHRICIFIDPQPSL